MRHFPSLSHVIYAQNIPFEININRFVQNSRFLHNPGRRCARRRLADEYDAAQGKHGPHVDGSLMGVW
jgi:hypothetical protein